MIHANVTLEVIESMNLVGLKGPRGEIYHLTPADARGLAEALLEVAEDLDGQDAYPSYLRARFGGKDASFIN